MDDGSLLFVGTATTVIRYGGFTLLTDPNFLHRGERAYLGRGLWSTRRTDPALELDQLPPIDVVVLSHLHGDHFDRVARDGLDKDVPIVTTPQSARRLAKWGFTNVEALATWQSAEFRIDGGVLRVTAAPGQHAPGPLNSLLVPNVMGSVLEFEPVDGRPLRMYITGDTLVHDALRELPKRYPDVDYGLWHLGGTRALGLLVTMDGRQGADLIEIVRPRTTVPIHYDDYGVFKSPLSEFLDAVERRGLSGVRPVLRGETIAL